MTTIPTPSIPTLTLGEYLYSQGYKNTVARYRDNTIKKRPFNPSVTLPPRYILDETGRAAPNPSFYITYQNRYGFYEDEISGSMVGERLSMEAIEKFCRDRGIPFNPQDDTSIIDALYVARDFGTAWDLLIAPASTPGGQGSGTTTGPATNPGTDPATSPQSGSTLPASSGLDPTSAVIADLRSVVADLRQQLVTQELLEATVEDIKKILSRKEFIPPTRGGGQPTIKWRNFYNAIVTALQGR